MKVLKKNKGFTLVELIVVIAIIGVLAAVLVPSVTGFINKGKISNDISDTRNMNTILSTYLFENDIDGKKLDAEDVKFIVQQQSSNYKFIPNYKKGVFYYNPSTSKIEYSSEGVDELKVFAEEGDYSSVEDIFGTGKLYLNSNGEIAEFLQKLRNIDNSKMYQNLGNNIPSGLTGLYQAFNPNKTLFIGSSIAFSSADEETQIEKVVFANNLKAIINPNIYSRYTVKPTTIIDLPLSVQFIGLSAFDYIVDSVTINSKSRTTVVLDNSFGPNVTTNAKKLSAESFANIIQSNNSLISVVNKENPTTVYNEDYSVSETEYVTVETSRSGELLIDLTRLSSVTYEDIKVDISEMQLANPQLRSFQADVDNAGAKVKVISFMAFDDTGIIAYVKIRVSATVAS